MSSSGSSDPHVTLMPLSAGDCKIKAQTPFQFKADRPKLFMHFELFIHLIFIWGKHKRQSLVSHSAHV